MAKKFRRQDFNEVNGYARGGVVMNKRTHVTDDVDGMLGRVRQDARQAAEAAGHVAVAVQIPRRDQPLCLHRTLITEKIVDAWSTDPFHPIMERSRHALAAAGCEVRPGKWRLPRQGMATAGGVLTKKYGIPTIGYGPGSEEKAHAPDESVRVENITEAAYGTAVIAQALVGVPVWGWSSDEF